MMSLWEALIRSFSEFFNLSSPISFGTNQFYLILAMGMFLVAYGSTGQCEVPAKCSLPRPPHGRGFVRG
jgi:hypothetical protein